jgi:cytochrome c
MYKNRILLMMTLATINMIACGAQSDKSDGPAELAKARYCLNCHAVNAKIVGPSYQSVAAKYAGQQGVEEKLVRKVLQGGSGVWGPVSMPPNTQVTEAEAHILVKWVLSQK